MEFILPKPNAPSLSKPEARNERGISETLYSATGNGLNEGLNWINTDNLHNRMTASCQNQQAHFFQ